MESHIKLTDISKVAKNIIQKATKLKNKQATVIGLRGDLGSGKTTLTQEMAKILGVKNKIASPTFVIMKSYELKDKKFKKLVHIDAYRLEKDSELLKLGWNEIIIDHQNIIILEWPEKVSGCVPKNTIFVDLYHKDHRTRTIKL